MKIDSVSTSENSRFCLLGDTSPKLNISLSIFRFLPSPFFPPPHRGYGCRELLSMQPAKNPQLFFDGSSSSLIFRFRHLTRMIVTFDFSVCFPDTLGTIGLALNCMKRKFPNSELEERSREIAAALASIQRQADGSFGSNPVSTVLAVHVRRYRMLFGGGRS